MLQQHNKISFIAVLGVILFSVATLCNGLPWIGFSAIALWLTYEIAKSDSFAIIATFIIVFISEQFSGLGLIPQTFPDALLLVVLVAFFIKIMVQVCKKKQMPSLIGIIPIVSFCVICVVSLYINTGSYMRMVVFLRALFQFYLFFYAILNSSLNEKDFKIVNCWILGLFIIQIPTALFKWFYYDYHTFSEGFGGETAVGTYGVSPGGLSVLLPLLVIGLFLIRFVATHNRLYIIGIFGYVLFSYLGGKRALPYALPFFLIFHCLCTYVIEKKWTKRVFLYSIALAFFVLITGSMIHPSLNPEGKILGSVSPRYLIHKFVSYSNDEKDSVIWHTNENVGDKSKYTKYTGGRLSSIKRSIREVWSNGYKTLLFGYGPGKYLKSSLVKNNFKEGYEYDFGIKYGFSGTVIMISQVGLIGYSAFLIILIVLAWYCWRNIKYIECQYWKSISIGVCGIFCVVIFDVCFYSTEFIMGKILPPLFLYGLASILMVSKMKKIG